MTDRVARRRRPLAALVVVIAVVTAVLALAPASGAQEAGNSIEIVRTDLTDFPTVRLRVALSGDIADTPLSIDDFTLTENDDPLEFELTALSDQVVAVTLVVDTSGSMAGAPISQAKAAAGQLLGALPANAVVSVIGFGNEATTLSDFTSDRGATRAAIDGLAATGETALYDAVVLAAAQSPAADRHAILLLTDGTDSVSDVDLAGATASLDGFTGEFFAVSLESGETDPEALGALADAAGGTVVSAADPDALAATYLDIGQRIVNQYQLTFTSVTPDPTGTFAIAVDGAAPATVSVVLPAEGRVTPTTAPPAPTTTPVLLDVTVSTRPHQQGWVLYLGALMVTLSAAFMVFVAVPSAEGVRKQKRPGRRSLQSDALTVEGTNVLTRTGERIRNTVNQLSSRAVESTESAGRIDAALDRAGLIMRAGEFVGVIASITLAAGLVAYLLLGVPGLVIGGATPLVGSVVYLRVLNTRRNNQFADQLSDTLLVMSGALRSGFGVGQAIDTVANEMDPPMSTEFQRAILETRLGRNVEDALDSVAKRVDNEDFEWVVDAMRINRQIGGDLASILDKVSETIRARNRLKRQVDALTAEGRISAFVLSLLPVGLGLVLFASNPDYLGLLFSRTLGWIMFGTAVALLLIGVAWLRSMINIEY